MRSSSFFMALRAICGYPAALGLLALAFTMAGCGADETSPVAAPPGPPACEAGQTLLEDGRCQPAGLPLDMQCNAGELPLEGGGCQPAGLPLDMPCPPGEASLEGGGCQPAGVPPDACAQGFETDGKGGCDPILPAAPCPPGQMAVPGETQCREIAPCGSGDYGTIPVEATTQFVNKAYAGANSDGTMAKPWKTIQAGINKAASGAIVAVAAGTYTEDLLIDGKLVRLWGRCPAMVSVVGTGAKLATLIIIHDGASQSDVRSLAITGPGVGIGSSGASKLLVDRVWIHDTMSRGLDINGEVGPSSVTVSASLIEGAEDAGVLIINADAVLEAAIVRDTQPRKDGTGGNAIRVRNGAAPNERSKLTLRASLLEQNHEASVFVIGSDAEIEATVVRTTQPNGAGQLGHGISSTDYALERPKVTLRTSLLELNHGAGISASGSDASIEATVVRATQPHIDGTQGKGVLIKEGSTLTLRASLLEQNHDCGVLGTSSEATIDGAILRDTQPNGPGTAGVGVAMTGGAKVTLHASILEQNHGFGVLVRGSEATIDGAIVRDTQPISDGTFGRGIEVQDDSDTLERATLTLRTSLLERNHDISVLVQGSEAMIEGSVVRDTQPISDGTSGVGIFIQSNPDTYARSTLMVRASLVEQNHEVGVRVTGSDATIEATVVRDTQPTGDGMFGRGIEIGNGVGPQSRSIVTLRSSLLEQNHDVGLLLNGSDATIEATVVRDTQSTPQSINGAGVWIQLSDSSPERSKAEIRHSVVENNRRAGVNVHDSDAMIEATVVRGTQLASDGTKGRGIGVEQSSTLALYTSVVEENHEAGIIILGSAATITETVVRATQPESNGQEGDGIVVSSQIAPATATITETRIEDNARAGISSFSAAIVLVSSTVQCNLFDLNGEDYVEGQEFTFDGSKDNLCGCADKPDPTCPVVSENLSAPEAISPVKPSN
jgi:hypothetical protein